MKQKFLIFSSIIFLTLGAAQELKGQHALRGTWYSISSYDFGALVYASTGAIEGKIYLQATFYNTADNTLIDTLLLFDPSTNGWSAPSMSAFHGGGIWAVYNEKMYAGNQIFDPSTNTWDTLIFNGPDYGIGISTVFNGKLYTFGGAGISTHSFIDSVFALDLPTRTWSVLPAKDTFTVGYASTCQSIGGKLYVAGEHDPEIAALQIQVYDLSTNTWSYPTINGPIFPLAGVLEGRIAAIGTDGTVVALDTLTNTFDTVYTTGTPPTYTLSNIYPNGGLISCVLNGNLYFFGGYNGNKILVMQPQNDVKADKSLLDISLSPNPTTGIITVLNAPENIQYVTVSTILGESVLELPHPNAQDFTLDLSKLPPGTYVARFSLANEVITRKIIKE